MRLPDYLIIGSAKSGTTTLYKYLCRHPQIYMSRVKEPEFFARDENYARGMDWYGSLFLDAKPDQICGEASTIYTRSPQFPQAPSRIARALPNVKFIYLMRNPVDRAFSHYAHQIKTAQNTKTQLVVRETFEEALKKPNCLLDSSHYLYQIECYLEFFPRESFLFLLMEDVIQDTESTLQKVCQFLNVDSEIDLVQQNSIYANQAKEHTQRVLRSQMTASLKSVPGVRTIASVLPQSVKDSAYQILKKLPYRQTVEQKYVPQPMLRETRQMLLEKFREPNQKLAEFLNRDLSAWSQ
ncbi:MAG: sulfotransferase [Cyanobacteriota bacterium]|nr:sulfotransferase [Cyanobacteriota bacterium]